MPAPRFDQNSPITSFALPNNISIEVAALIYQYYAKWGEHGLGTGATVYYSFPTLTDRSVWNPKFFENGSGEGKGGGGEKLTAESFSDVQVNAAHHAFEQWSNVADLNFDYVEVETPNGVGDIRFWNLSRVGNSESTYAMAVPPSTFEDNYASGEIVFRLDENITSLEEYALGGFGSYAMMHEIGHALGLAHPFEGSIELAHPLDKTQYTVMSYSDVYGDRVVPDTTFYPTTPMLLDIQAIQYIYGANTTYNNEDNVYQFGETYAYQTIWDTDGSDTIQNTGELNSVINLNAGEFSSIGPSIKLYRASTDSASQQNIAIAYGVTIENAIGGSANDIIYGNSTSNVIDGGEGSDTFITGLKKGDVTSIIQLDDGTVLLSSELEQDKLTNIEKVNFSDSEFFMDSLLDDAVLAPEYYLTTDDKQENMLAQTYVGPVDYLQFTHLGGADNEVVNAANTNDFLNLLGGDDAANGGGGQDVLDGGTGSNFLTGGYGADVFFIDGRSGEVTWSTVTDFDGDQINIWGWEDGVSQVLVERVDGAVGYEGITLHMDLDGNHSIDTSVTFSGLMQGDVAHRQSLSVQDIGYLYIG